MGEVSSILPRGAASNGIITVIRSIRRISPEYVQAPLEFLKSDNYLYNDVIVAVENIPDDLVSNN